MCAEKFSQISRYRRYYEHLHLAYQEITSKRRNSPTLEYPDGFKEKIFYPLILSHLSAEEPLVLDAGCGTGKDLLSLAHRRLMRCYGVDFTWNSLSLAQKQSKPSGKNLFWIQSPVEQLPFQDKSFEGVLFSEAIEHLLYPDLALREIKRVLNPGSSLFLTTPNRYSYFSIVTEILPKSLKSFLKQLIWNMPRDYQASSHYFNDPQVIRHVREFGPGELREILQKNGFKVSFLRGGALAVPIPSIFDRWKFLLNLWKFLDRLISFIPGSVYLKESIIVMATVDSCASHAVTFAQAHHPH